MRKFLAIAILAALPALGQAQCYTRPTYVEKVVTPTYPVATITAVPFFVPTYFTSYIPPPVYMPPPAQPAPVPVPPVPAASAMPQAQASSCEQKLDVIMRRLEAMEKAIGGGPAASTGGPPFTAQAQAAAQTAGTSAEAILTNRCAKCHDGAVAKEKGNGLIYFQENKLLALAKPVRAGIASEVYNRTMPKGGPPLSDQDVQTIQAWVAQGGK